MKVETFTLKGNGRFPNSRLPLVIYREAVSDSPAVMTGIMRSNGWPPDWYSSMGMYPRHHFHSDTHEFIAVTRGQFTCLFGGDDGARAHMKAGDVVVIPAGVAHFGDSISEDLRLVGAFPSGYGVHDFRLGYPEEYGRMVGRAQRVPIPATDPLYGANGALIEIWSNVDKELR